MLWLVAPSVVALSSSALLLSGCAKGREEVKRPKSGPSSDKQKQSGKSSSRNAGVNSSKSSRREGKPGDPSRKSSRSKREGDKSGKPSDKSGRSSSSKRAVAPLAGAGAAAAAGGKSSKSSRSKREGDKSQGAKKPADALAKDKSTRSSRSKRSSRRSGKSRRSSRSKRDASGKKLPALKEDKTQEISVEVPPAKPTSNVKTAISPMAVSVTKLELAPVEGVVKQELRIEPTELRWKTTGGIQHVAVYNHSNKRKALKVKCSDNLLYRVNPVHTFIAPGGSARVDILRQNGTAKVDKIVLIAADAAVSENSARDVLNRSANTDMMVLPLIAAAAN